jgi:hypothetical protein
MLTARLVQRIDRIAPPANRCRSEYVRYFQEKQKSSKSE